DQVIQNDGGPESAGFVYKRAPVLENHRARRLIRFVLCGDIDPVIPHGAWVNPAGAPFVLGYLALWDVGVALGIGPENVIFGCVGRRSKEQDSRKSKGQLEHVPDYSGVRGNFHSSSK